MNQRGVLDPLLSLPKASLPATPRRYAYRREFLLSLAKLPPSPLERVEKLEQLRVLEAGHRIAVAVVPQATLGIDTPHDYRAFVERRRKR